MTTMKQLANRKGRFDFGRFAVIVLLCLIGLILAFAALWNGWDTAHDWHDRNTERLEKGR